MFNPYQYQSLTALLEGHRNYLHTNCLQPFLNRIEDALPGLTQDFQNLRSSFLRGPPIPESESSLDSDFSQQSQTKHLASQVRRYTLGTQARGIHARMRHATTEAEHLQYAYETPHPTITAQNVLEPSWSYVFNNLTAGYQTWGAHMANQLVLYRTRVRGWFRKLLHYWAPLQKQLIAAQPPGPRSVSGHINTVFFYVLLRLSNYANPSFAFRFWHGAPIVGEFESVALREKTRPFERLTDDLIRATAVKCARSLKSVRLTLSPKAAEKSMKKMDSEFASGTLRGPYSTVEELRLAIQTEIRKNPGFEHYVVRPEFIVISPQFTVQELHAYEEAAKDPAANLFEMCASFSVQKNGDSIIDEEFKIRNIWNAKIMNVLTSAKHTYVPHQHSDVAVIVLNWITLLSQFGFEPALHGYPADFKAAYRQMPIYPLHMLFAASAYFHYEAPHFTSGVRKYAFYTSLPFGSSIAPADWGETVVALAHIMAYIVLAIITHCVDDICGIETEDLVSSSRETFLYLVSCIGLTLDMEKSLTPRADFIYLGLRMLLPCRFTKQIFAIKIPPARRAKLIGHLERILQSNSLTSGDASSMRGRLFFYAYWFQEARSYLAAFAARQYCQDPESGLTQELILALNFFLHTLKYDPKFIAGIQPLHIMNRAVCYLYTDGSLEGHHSFPNLRHKAIGGIIFEYAGANPLWFGESINPSTPGYRHIAPVEMFAILRALHLFGDQIRDKAVWLFCDNAHSVGCLLRRSSKVNETPTRKRATPSGQPVPPSPEAQFLALEDDIRTDMNILARAIWQKLTELNALIWVEYVWTKVNLADDPSRGKPPKVPGERVGRHDF